MSQQYFCNQLHLNMPKGLEEKIYHLGEESRYWIVEMLIQALATDLKKQLYSGDLYLGESPDEHVGGIIFNIHHPNNYNNALREANRRV